MNSNFLTAKSFSLDYIRQVQAKLDPKTYHKFIHILKQFRHRNIHSSIAAVTITNLFRNHHPQLLLEFERNFVPAKYTAASGAAAADQADSVDFLKRVEARFKLGRNANGDYRKFLSLLVAYSKGEIAVSDVRSKVIGIFHKHSHQDLAAEFVTSFLPDSCLDAAAVETPPPNKRRRVKETITKEQYFTLEDKLIYVDVQIRKLTATQKQAVDLTRRLSTGSLSAADVRLEEHFDSPLYVIGIKRLCREMDLKINVDEDICRVMPQLIEKMAEEIVEWKDSRVDLVSTMEDYLAGIEF